MPFAIDLAAGGHVLLKAQRSAEAMAPTSPSSLLTAAAAHQNWMDADVSAAPVPP